MDEALDGLEASARKQLEAPLDRLVAPETGCLHLVQPFTLAGTPGCKELAIRLFKACAFHKGWGLAAPQIGVNASMAVVVLPQVRLAFCMVNPQIKRLFGRETVAIEQCLSLPGVKAYKLRHEMVDVIFQDQFGKTHHVVTGGILSRVIQHEVAHLRGLLITHGTVKAAPLRDTADEQKPETQPVDGDRLPANEREIREAPLQQSVPAEGATGDESGEGTAG